MSKKRNSSYDMYENLLNAENNEILRLTNPGLSSYQRPDNDEDTEMFTTSKEIVETRRNFETTETGVRVNNNGIMEESIHFHRYSKRRKHKYTETEMNAIRQSCLGTIVHDYGENDWYHVSDEYRAEHDYLSEVSLKLASLRRTYSLPSKYIEAMRVVFEAWTILSQKNYIHDKEEFFEMVARGDIVSPRIIMPKLKKMDSYNTDMLIEYISNPELDPTHLDPVKATNRWDDDDFWSTDNDETEEEEMHRLLSTEEVQYILEHRDNPEKIELGSIKPKYIQGYDRRNGTKRKKKESKKDHYTREELAVLLNKIQNSSHYKGHGNSYMVTHSLFEPEKEETSFWDNIKFDGSWGDDDAVSILDLVVMEEIAKQHPPREKYLTYGDKWLQEFFRTLEDNGINTVELSRNMSYSNEDINKRKEQLTKKEQKRRESDLLQRITKLNNQSKFKKIVKKAEEELTRFREDETHI